MNMRTIILTIIFCISFSNISISQEDDSLEIDIAAFVWMDSMVVTASRNDFDVKEFIDMVQKDKSFYQAFRNIRTMKYAADNDIKMLDKNGQSAATYKSKTIQSSDGKCRTMEFLNEEHTGNYYKKGKKLKYYTAKMYDRLFFTHGKKCEGNGNEKKKKKKGMEKYVAELKKLIFQPGERVNVPFIKNKTEIFSKKMIKYYDFLISSKTYEDGRDCYVFTAKLKEKYKDNDKKTVISFLETYFTKEDFQVIARDYTLHYKGAAFDFDIDMKIKLQKMEEKYVPSFLSYKGTWDVPTKKPEWSHFNATFYNYE